MYRARQNFSDIIRKFLNHNNDQILRIFLTKIFYYLRRSQNELCFGFFFETLHETSLGDEIIFYKKLCEWRFYVDDLAQIYDEIFNKLLRLYLSLEKPSYDVGLALCSASLVVKFEVVYQIFEDIGIVEIHKMIKNWRTGDLPKIIVESALAVLFPEGSLIHELNLKDNMVFSQEFKNIVKEKSKVIRYDSNLWNCCISLESHENSPSTSLRSGIDDEILINLKSNHPTDIAYGLYNLRKAIEANTQFEVEQNLVNSIMNLVSHDDR